MPCLAELVLLCSGLQDLEWASDGTIRQLAEAALVLRVSEETHTRASATPHVSAETPAGRLRDEADNPVAGTITAIVLDEGNPEVPNSGEPWRPKRGWGAGVRELYSSV